jgi:hypothetical protein
MPVSLEEITPRLPELEIVASDLYGDAFDHIELMPISGTDLLYTDGDADAYDVRMNIVLKHSKTYGVYLRTRGTGPWIYTPTHSYIGQREKQLITSLETLVNPLTENSS